MDNIPLSKVFLNDEIRSAASAALESGVYILGSECEAFEQELAAYTGTRHAVLSSSWTAAMLLLLQVMELSAGDEVIVPAHTAFPTIEPIILVGAKPVFVDVDGSYCMDPAQVSAAIGPRTVGIMPVHLYGHPADMEAIQQLAARHGLWVLEDCAQAQGAMHLGRRVGAIGQAGGFSFYPSKNLTVLGDGVVSAPTTSAWRKACACCAITAAKTSSRMKRWVTICVSTRFRRRPDGWRCATSTSSTRIAGWSRSATISASAIASSRRRCALGPSLSTICT